MWCLCSWPQTWLDPQAMQFLAKCRRVGGLAVASLVPQIYRPLQYRALPADPIERVPQGPEGLHEKHDVDFRSPVPLAAAPSLIETRRSESFGSPATSQGLWPLTGCGAQGWESSSKPPLSDTPIGLPIALARGTVAGPVAAAGTRAARRGAIGLCDCVRLPPRGLPLLIRFP